MTEQAYGLVAAIPGTGERPNAANVPLVGVRIEVRARGRASAVTVSQRYLNREKVPVEAVYSFPLEEQAAVYGFAAQIGERRWVGRVEEAEAAFDAYEQALAEGHGAYLLDQDRPNLFTASVGNLLPGQEAVVTVRYVAPLEEQGERVRLRIPTTVAPRYVPKKQLRSMDPAEFDHLNPPMSFAGVPYGLALTIEYTGDGEISKVECASHPAQVHVAGREARVDLMGDDVQLDQDVVVAFVSAPAGATAAQVARDERGDAIVALHVRPPAVTRRAPVEAVLLLDRSGSMMGSSIAQARNALLLALASLAEGDTFNVWGFGSQVESVFPSAVPYDDAHLEKARRAVEGWDADLGGTELLPPLQTILRAPRMELPRRVLLLTDGEVANEEECAALVAKHAATTNVFTIGIGYGASDYLVRALARASAGYAETVHPNERIEPVVMRQMTRLGATRLGDVRVDWGGLPVDLVAPAVPSALYPGTSLTVYGRVPRADVADASGGSVEVAVVADAADGPVRFAARADLASAVVDEALPRLFAREALRELEEGRGGAERGSRQRARTREHVDAAIRELATRYTLMSSLTSFVAVEERDAAADVPAAELRRIPVALLKDWHGSGAWGARPMAALTVQSAPGTTGLAAPFTVGKMMAPLAAGIPAVAKRARRGARSAPVQGLPTAGAPGFDAVTAPDSSVDEGADALVALVRGQRADGRWSWTDEILREFGGERAAAMALMSDLVHVLGPADADVPAMLDEVAPTLLVLGLLRRDFAAREAEWRLLADKAVLWLAGRGVRAPAGEAPEDLVAARLGALR
ncbi:MAG: VIT and VWA domain-containing protein [Thermoleophilia bacterium]